MVIYKKLFLLVSIVLMSAINSSYTMNPTIGKYSTLISQGLDTGFSKGITKLAQDLTTYTAYQTINLAKLVCNYAIARSMSLYNSGILVFRKKTLQQADVLEQKKLMRLLKIKIQELPFDNSLILTKNKDGSFSCE